MRCTIPALLCLLCLLCLAAASALAPAPWPVHGHDSAMTFFNPAASLLVHSGSSDYVISTDVYNLSLSATPEAYLFRIEDQNDILGVSFAANGTSVIFVKT